MQKPFVRNKAMTITAKITSKGQITIPRAARAALKTNTVEVEIQGGLGHPAPSEKCGWGAGGVWQR
jgi:hypothetical protein